MAASIFPDALNVFPLFLRGIPRNNG